MYPKNAASPEPIAIGAVIQISDGAVQTSGCTVRIKPVGVAEGDGAGTTAYSTDGIVYYTPTQAETNYTSFILIAKKTACIPVSITVVTSGSATAGHAALDWGVIANKTTTNALTGTTIATTQKVDVETIKTNPVVNAGTVTFPTTATLASTTNITAAAGCAVSSIGTNVITATSINADAITAAKIADGAIDAATFAAGAINAAAIASDAITAAKIADGAIDAATFAAGAINAAAIASDAITDAKVASDVTIASVTGSVGSIASGGISEASYATTAGAFAPLGIIDQGTAQSASSTGIVLRSAAAFDDDVLIGATIFVFGSTQGYWQQRIITDNALSGDTVTVDTWTVTPSGTITYKIFATPPSLTTLPNVNVTQISGDSVAADNAESFFDGTGYAGTNNVIPTVTTVTTTSSEVTAIKAKTDSLTFTVSNKVDSNVLAIAGSTTAATNQSKAALAVYPGTCTSTGTTTTLIDTGLTQVDDHWIGRVVIFLTGTLAYQATQITDFTASSDTLTLVALTSAPQSGDTYVIV